MNQRNLFDYNFEIDLPAQDRFPINEPLQDRTVKEILLKDIRNSEQYLIVTGFTSLSHLIELFGATDNKKMKLLRVVIGYDPDERVSKRLAHYSLSTEIKNFWLKQNVSIKLCSSVINLIENIKKGRFIFKVKDKLHAKIYLGNDAAVLGSSNFSKSGTVKNPEANIRVLKDKEVESNQYLEIKKIAEYYYNQAEDYNKQLLELLDKLLKDVGWEEALARAMAEVLESPWMKDYSVLYNALLNHQLWPSQKVGLSKAMKIIQDQGRVLIADPTGSGKTKFATALAFTLFHWLWENGLKDRSNALIICPKQVMDNWDREQEPFKIPNKIASMSKLSQGKELTIKRLQKEIENKDILIIDEAHNYLRPSSLRSKAINPRSATHIILSTATPINKKPEDLLRLVELLDIDNLSDEDLKTYKQLRRNKGKQMSPETLGLLRSYINRFIIRRTKKELNQMIQRDPENYKNRNGHPCRYPKTKTDVYTTGETEEDKRIALEITEAALQLKGIHYLQNWKIPSFYKKQEDKIKYVANRFRSATALSAFMIRSCLRSSVCALVEYLHGTDKANELFEIKAPKLPTGNILGTIEKCKQSFEKIHFPALLAGEGNEWITDRSKYIEECQKEILIYQKISKLADRLSRHREKTKAQILVNKFNDYGKILAFDSKIITLEYIRHLIHEIDDKAEILLATGSNEKTKQQVKEYFSLQTKHKEPLIALCSDAMAEGINLPDAKALVLLDMPSVLRIIEQRIGRLERMDSEHDEIHVYWPDDSAEFSLKGDQRIVEILLMAENLIGINVDIPRTIYDRHLAGVNSTKDYIKKFNEYQDKDAAWEGVKDNTQSLYRLMERPDKLISKELYEEFTDVEVSVKTAISFVETEKTFSFFAFRGSVSRSPKWLFIDERNVAFTEFDDISRKLREYLTNESVIYRKWAEVDTDREMRNILLKLRRMEKSLLPHKKRRALNVGHRLLLEIRKNEDPLKTKCLLAEKLLSLMDDTSQIDDWIDYNHFADLWLNILLPALDTMRQATLTKRKIITLSDLKLSDVKIEESDLSLLLENCQYSSTLDELVAACIIGLPSKKW